MMCKTIKRTIAVMALMIIAAPVIAQEIAPFADYLPADTMFVVSFPQTAELKAFLERPEIKRLLDLVVKQPEFAEGYAKFKQEFTEGTGITPEEMYDRLDGDLTIAMLSFPISNDTPDVVVMIGMSGGPEAIAADLDRIVTAAAEKKGTEAEQLMISGHRVYKISEDTFFSNAYGHFMIASSANALQHLFSDDPRLGTSPGFARHRELVGLNEGITAYINFEPINALIHESISEKQEGDVSQEIDAEASKALLDIFDLDKIFGISLTVPLRPNSSARLFVHSIGYDGIFTKIFSPDAVDRGIVTALASHTDSLAAVSLQKPILILDYFINLASMFNPQFSPAMFDASIASFKEQSGVDLRQDLIASLGKNVGFGVHLKDGANLDFSKSPLAFFQAFEIDMLWQLTNQEAFSRSADILISMISETMPGSFVTEEYEGAVIHSLAVELPGLSLSMAIHDGYVRIATRDSTGIKALINGLRSGENAAAAPGFQQAASSIPSGANMLTYTSADYIRKYIELSLNMLPDAASEDVPEEAMEYISVLSEGARNVAAKGRSYSSYLLPVADGLYGEGKVDLADQLYVIMLELTKYFYLSDMEDMDVMP